MLNKNLTLGEFIIKNQASFKYSSGELSSLINSIRLAAKIVNHEVNKAGLVDIIGETGGENIQFEKQQKLDVYANEKFIKTLINRNIVCGIASEEEDSFISINSIDKNNQNKYVVLIDPLDCSSNIDVNVSVGTIFSVYRRKSKIGSEVELDECNPIVFICEQAGGSATNGYKNILDIKPTSLHERIPFYCGSKKMIKDLQNFL